MFFESKKLHQMPNKKNYSNDIPLVCIKFNSILEYQIKFFQLIKQYIISFA
jgi:hypothetical protein